MRQEDETAAQVNHSESSPPIIHQGGVNREASAALRSGTVTSGRPLTAEARLELDPVTESESLFSPQTGITGGSTADEQAGTSEPCTVAHPHRLILGIEYMS